MPKLLVTGMSGFLGAEVVRQAAARGWVVTGTHRRRPVAVGGVTSVALDVRDAEAVAAMFERVRPDAVVHTAYVKGVSAAEATIVEGTAHVVAAARRHGVRIVHVSTDVVFGGRAEPYATDDPPDPVDDYGLAKAAAERVVGEVERAVIVRTSLLYSIARPCPVVQMVTDADPDTRFFVDEYRCPTLVEDVADGLIRLAADDRTGIAHLNAAEVVSRYEFACLIAAHHGMRADAVTPGSVATHMTRRPSRVALIPSLPGYRNATEVLRPRSS